MPPKSPYQEALDFIEAHPGTGSSVGMARLILSLWNETVCYSFRECVRAFDDDRCELARRIVSHFLIHGEDEELRQVGHQLCERYPRMWEMTRVMMEARYAKQDEWEREREAEARRLYPND